MLLEKKNMIKRRNLDSLSFHYQNLIKIYTKKPKKKFSQSIRLKSKSKNLTNYKKRKFNFDMKHEIEKLNLNKNLKKLKKRPFSNFSKNNFYKRNTKRKDKEKKINEKKKNKTKIKDFNINIRKLKSIYDKKNFLYNYSELKKCPIYFRSRKKNNENIFKEKLISDLFKLKKKKNELKYFFIK